MTITTVDEVANALANSASHIVIDKASLANTVAGQLFSLWRATGQPAQGEIPTTAAICTKALAGAIAFDNQTAPATSYIGWLVLMSSNSASGLGVHDRIAHFGGLVLDVTTAQTVAGLDLQTLAPDADRLGDANYSDGQWFLDVYADGGATASNATIAVTYNDGTSGNLSVQAVGGTLRAGRSIPLTPLIPVAQQGKFIRAITSVTLSASTGTAGNFGFTYRRLRTFVPMLLANLPTVADWAALGLPNVPNDSCLEFMVSCGTTSTGAIRGQGKIAHG